MCNKALFQHTYQGKCTKIREHLPNTKEFWSLPRCCTFGLARKTANVIDRQNSRCNKPWSAQQRTDNNLQCDDQQVQVITTAFLDTHIHTLSYQSNWFTVVAVARLVVRWHNELLAYIRLLVIQKMQYWEPVVTGYTSFTLKGVVSNTICCKLSKLKFC